MGTPAEQLDVELSRFQRAYPVEGRHLRDIVASSPELRERLLQAIQAGHLDGGFQPVSEEDRRKGVLGAYHSGTEHLYVPMDQLRGADAQPAFANTVLATLGHEVAHAIHKDSIQRSWARFDQHIDSAAASPAPRNYTPAIKEKLSESRVREATDEIGGVNVLAAKIKRENPGARQQELYKLLFDACLDVQGYFDRSRHHGVDVYTPKPGITFNDRFQIEPTAQNVEAFGQHFFDHNRYPQVYGQRLIDRAGRAETQAVAREQAAAPARRPVPPAQIDLSALGIHAAGVTLPAQVIDGSSIRRVASGPQDPPLSAVGQALLRDSERHVRETASRHGLAWDPGMDNTVAAMAAQAQATGLRAITHFRAAGDRLLLAHLDGDLLRETELDAGVAANTPRAQSLDSLRARDSAPHLPDEGRAQPAQEAPPAHEPPVRALTR